MQSSFTGIETPCPESGASLVEYALLIALIAVVVLVIVRNIGLQSAQVFSEGAATF